MPAATPHSSARVSDVSGIPLVQDGDVLRYDGDRPASEASDTELALRVLAARLGMSATEMRRDLEGAKSEAFARSALYARVFALADAIRHTAAPRAVVPAIVLSSPKITRRLTTEWFARRVNERFAACMHR